MKEGPFGDSTNRQATLEIDASDTNEQSYSEKLHLISNIAHEELKGVDFSDPLIRYRYYEEALLAMNSIRGMGNYLFVGNECMDSYMGREWIDGGITRINKEISSISEGLNPKTRFDPGFNKMFKAIIFRSTPESVNDGPSWSQRAMKYTGPDLSDDQLLSIQKALIISDLYLSPEIDKKLSKNLLQRNDFQIGLLYSKRIKIKIYPTHFLDMSITMRFCQI